MAENPLKNPSFKRSPGESSPDSLRSREGADKINEAGAVREAYEAVGLEEGAETLGEVSENSSEGKDKKGVGMKAGAGSYDPAVIKAQLLKNLPNEKVMRAQIEKEIKKEIKYLHKKAVKMLSSPGSMSYFEMSNLMRKVRELKGILLSLMKVSFDKLKTLWLRFVHGTM